MTHSTTGLIPISFGNHNARTIRFTQISTSPSALAGYLINSWLDDIAVFISKWSVITILFGSNFMCLL
jgi:hypothetical protein